MSDPRAKRASTRRSGLALIAAGVFGILLNRILAGSFELVTAGSIVLAGGCLLVVGSLLVRRRSIDDSSEGEGR